VILVLFEAYSEWASHKDVESAVKSHTSPYDFLEGERSFSLECLRSFVGKLNTCEAMEKLCEVLYESPHDCYSVVFSLFSLLPSYPGLTWN
jgi:hypothetical protein